MTGRSTPVGSRALGIAARLAVPLLLSCSPLACGHAKTVGDTEAKVASETEETPEKPKATRAEHHKVVHVDKPIVGDGSGVPLATSPSGLLKPHGIEEIQEKLESKGHLATGAATGKLDGPTHEALRAFQRDSGLPATGMPDDATVQKLGLRPSDVFRASGGDDAKK